MEDTHTVARHIVLSFPQGTLVGFNQSARGEGYIMVNPAVDVSTVVQEMTGASPIRVVTWADIESEPDGFGVPQNI
jgi:hypothetical protein